MASALVSSPVTLAGWALDANAPSGTGTSSVSLWAYPRPGSGQLYTTLGTATYGVERPAVAASHGERFRYSGYTLTTGALAPGPYHVDIAAYHPTSGVYSWRGRQFYLDTPTVPMTIDRPGTGTGGVTASGLSCPGGSTTQAVPCGAIQARSEKTEARSAPELRSSQFEVRTVSHFWLLSSGLELSDRLRARHHQRGRRRRRAQ